VRLFLFALLLLVARPARAHLMLAEQGTIAIDGAYAFVVVALPMRAFPGVDDDGNGLVDASELERHARAIAEASSARFSIPGARRLSLDLALGNHDEPSPYLVLIEHVELAGDEVEVRTDGSLEVTLRARRGSETEQVVLSAARRSHTLFMPPFRRGLSHLGLGQLAFLLVLAIVARKRPALLAAFGVAQIATMALVVRSSSIDLLVILTIAAMVAHGLRRSPSLAAGIALALACGVVHGLAVGGHGIGFGAGILTSELVVMLLALLVQHAHQLFFRAGLRGRLQRHPHARMSGGFGEHAHTGPIGLAHRR
jgi:hypothetical protein